MTFFRSSVLFILVSFSAHIAASSQNDLESGVEAIPYELALTKPILFDAFRISSDGRYVAYIVHQTSAEINWEGGYLSSGASILRDGTTIQVMNLLTGEAIRVCADNRIGSPNYWHPSWSPDSKTLAFHSDTDGQVGTWLYDVNSGVCSNASDALVKDFWSVDAPIWGKRGQTIFLPLVPEDTPELNHREPIHGGANQDVDVPTVRVLKSARGSGVNVSLGSNESEDENYRLAWLRQRNVSIGVIDVQSGQSKVVLSATAEPRPANMRLSPSGSWLSYTSVIRKHSEAAGYTVDLAVVPPAGGNVLVLARDLPDFIRADNYQWHPTDDKVIYSKGGGLWLVGFDRAGPDKARRLGADLGNLVGGVGFFTQDGEAVLVGTSRDRMPTKKPRTHASTDGLALVPLDGSTPTRFSIDQEQWSFVNVLEASPGLLWQPDGKSITIQLSDKRTGEIAIVRIDTEIGREESLWVGRATYSDFTAGTNQNEIFAVYEDFRTPQDIYAFTPDFKSKRRITHVAPELDSIPVGMAEAFETLVPFHDGSMKQVQTTVLLPPGAKKGDRLPAIVIFYPGARFSEKRNQFGGGYPIDLPALIFTSRGYAIVLADVLIGPGNEAGNAIDEITDALLPQVYKAADLGYVDINRLALRGTSFSAYGTAAVVSKTKLFRAAIPSNGSYDLGGSYGDRLMMNGSNVAARAWWSEHSQPRMGTHVWANPLRYIENSPYYRADKITTPMLIIQGGADDAVTESEKLFTALDRLDGDVELAIYEGGGHAIRRWRTANVIDAANRMTDFLKKHLGEGWTSK